MSNSRASMSDAELVQRLMLKEQHKTAEAAAKFAGCKPAAFNSSIREAKRRGLTAQSKVVSTEARLASKGQTWVDYGDAFGRGSLGHGCSIGWVLSLHRRIVVSPQPPVGTARPPSSEIGLHEPFVERKLQLGNPCFGGSDRRNRVDRRISASFSP